ncbi:hypothetical protein SAMN05421759_12337 [Roseivivax lentus]|uniref:Uncharacterized protein n=1 Tax=Roseivivax lentus TaxID=633194 RepID=A0A1N7PZM8_9RHOB|nr:hypothetical protein [Roseivivax lentus]SIT16060.1 hypothetical protein SAMN05421759_12337 [Roseivivax lentus]
MLRKLIIVTLVLAGVGAVPATASRMIDVDVETTVTGPRSPFYPEQDDLTEC